VRFNFRGVGASEGVHDEGRGELEDMLHVVGQLAPKARWQSPAFPSAPSWHRRRPADALERARLQQIVLVGTAAARNTVATLPVEAHERTLVVHGEADDTVPLSAVMDWARPQSLPVTVVPGGGHFFHGQLPLLKSLVVRHLRAGT
jgi:alpha/beta superfamily hydrolase